MATRGNGLGGWDFEATTGHRLELKQAAAKQSWAQTKPSKGIFDIASRSGRYEGAAWFPGPGRFADLYVFAWHGGWDANADQRDETQWDYFVVPSSALPQQKTIGLASLKRLAVPTSAASLASGVDVVARTITPRSVVLPNASR